MTRLITYNQNDIKKVSGKSECPHRAYELQRASWLQNRLNYAQLEYLASGESAIIHDLSNFVKDVLKQTDHMVMVLNDTNFGSKEIWNKCNKVIESSTELLTYIDDLKWHPVREYSIAFTDAGPGEGVNNYQVSFREIEIAQLHKSVLRYRVHLASDDQGQNEAERTNAYIG